MRTFPRNQDVSVKLKSELIFVKGVYSKPSGDYIVSPNLCFLVRDFKFWLITCFVIL